MYGLETSRRMNAAQRNAVQRAIGGVLDELARYKHSYPGPVVRKTLLLGLGMTVQERIDQLENDLLQLQEGL